jgi:hypothetical protein
MHFSYASECTRVAIRDGVVILRSTGTI